MERVKYTAEGRRGIRTRYRKQMDWEKQKGRGKKKVEKRVK